MFSTLRQVESYFELKTPIIWINVLGMIILHVFALYGMFLIPRAKILTFFWAFLVMVLADTSTTLGAHRLWTHKSYKAKLSMRIVLMLCYMMGGLYSLEQWVWDHRTHHLYVDTDADPHSAGRGLFYSHVGWLLMKRHPDCKAKGKNVDLSDLYKDPVIRFHQRYFVPLTIVFHIIFPSAVTYYVIGDTLENAVFITLFFRSALSYNMLWCVNSLAHYWGDRPYNKDILAAQNTILSMFLVGEGWHNFHHTFPYDYRLAEFGQANQFVTWIIDVCARFGLATNLRTASQAEIDRAVDNNNKKIQEELKLKEKMATTGVQG